MTAFIFLLVTFLAVGFAWEMRGDLIGGEEGAMFPGAILGLCISLFVPVSGLKEFFFLPMALGMIGMFFGGTETYAETFDFTYYGKTLKDKPDNLRHGLAGLSLKGAPWFGICASVLAVGIKAFSNENPYKWYELVILVVLIPVARILGIKIFNSPFDFEKKIFPKFYFSKERKEEWGGLLFINALFLIFTLVKKDWFSVIIIAFGTVGGAISWVIAQMAHSLTKTKNRKGKYFFGKLQEKGYIDNWKLMEFLFGALGSVFIALGFVVQKNSLNEIFTDKQKIYGSDKALLIAFIVLFFVDAILNLFMKKNKTVMKIKNIIHRPIVCYVPMLFIFLGVYRAAIFSILVVLVWQPLEELVFYQLYKADLDVKLTAVIDYIFIAIMTFVSLAVTPANFFAAGRINQMIVFICLSVEYIICASLWNIIRHMHINNENSIIKSVKEMKSFQSVKINYLLCVIISAVLMADFS